MEEKIIYKEVSLNLMRKVLSTIDEDSPERIRVENIIDKIYNGNYFFIHFDMNKSIDSNDIMKYQNYLKQVFESNYVYKYEGYFKEFEVEMVKFGKSIFGSSEIRYALFHFPLGFFSSPSPINKSTHLEDLRKVSKDKTLFLTKSKIVKESRTLVSTKDWILENKLFRISLLSQDQIDKPISLYFDEEKKMKRVYSFLMLIKINKNFSEMVTTNLEKLRRLIDYSYHYYAMIKLIELKNIILRRKTALNSMNVFVNNSFNPLKVFGKEVLNKWLNHYSFSIKVKKSSNKTMLKHPFFYKPKVFNVSSLKQSIIKIKEFLKENKTRYYSDMNKDDKNPSYIRITNAEIKGLNIGVDFDEKKFKTSKKAIFNKNKLEIDFEKGNVFTFNYLMNISNLFVNINLENKFEENCIVINGPRLNDKLFFKYFYKKDFLKTKFSTKFIDPEYHLLSLNQTTYSSNSIVLQFFYSSINLNINEVEKINNFYYRSRNNQYDINSFVYFLKISYNDKYSTRTFYSKASKIDDEMVYIEFNTELHFKISTNKLFHNSLKIILCLVPIDAFDYLNTNDVENNYLIDFLSAYEMGSCYLRPDRNEYILESQSYFNNKIIINVFEAENNENLDMNFLYGTNLYIGTDVYKEENIDYSFIEEMRQKVKDENYSGNFNWDIKYDENKNILCRPPKNKEYKYLLGYKNGSYVKNEECLIDFLSKEILSNEKEINLIFENRKIDYLPCIQTFDDKISERTASLEYDSLKEFGYSKGDMITRVNKFKKYSVNKILGVDEDKNILLKCYLTNKIKSISMKNENMKCLKPIQENLFSIYNFKEIEVSTAENLGNYEWKIMLKFNGESEMRLFLYLLKDLKRKAVIRTKNTRQLFGRPIKLVNSFSPIKLKANTRILKIRLIKVELLKTLNFDLNSKLHITFDSVKNNYPMGNHYIDSLKKDCFTSSLLKKKEFFQHYSLYKSLKDGFKSISRKFDFSALKIKSSNKVLKFPQREDLNKIIELEIRRIVDNYIVLELKIITSNDEYTLRGDLNIHPFFFDKSLYADIELVKLKLNDKIVGYIQLNVFYSNNTENTSFDNIFSSILSSTLHNEDSSNISFNKIEPNIHRRNLMNTLIKELKIKSISEIDSDFLKETKKKHNLLKILEKYSIDGTFKLNKDITSNVWRELVININHENYKLKKKQYFYQKKSIIQREHNKEEYLRIFSNLLKCEISSSFDILKLFDNFPKKEHILKMKKNHSSKIKLLESLMFLGIPDEIRLLTWDKLLDIDNLINHTIENVYQNLKIPESMYTFLNKLNDGDRENKKKQLYFIFNHDLETKYPFIDSDINLLHLCDIEKGMIINSETTDIVKRISKAYINWTELQIIINPLFLKEKVSSKLVYFLGLLKIIQNLYFYIKEEYRVFWIICGLSQILEIFYQNNPLFMNQMTFTSSCIAMIEILLEIKLGKIKEKLIELNFSIDFYLYNMISSFFAGYLNNDIFIRILDFLIFNGCFRSSISDKYLIQNILCSVALTFFELYETSILQSKSVYELDRFINFQILKMYKVEKFIERMKKNMEMINNEFQETDMINKILSFSNNTYFYEKCENSFKQTKEMYSNILIENIIYLKQKCKLDLKKLINNIKEEICHNHLPSMYISFKIRKSMYSSKSDSDHSSKLLLLIEGYYIVFIISSIYEFNQCDNKEKKLIMNYCFKDVLSLNLSENSKNKNMETIIVRNGIVVNPMFYTFENKNIPSYLNIYLYENDSIFANFKIDLRRLDFMKPTKLRLESRCTKNGLVLLDISLIKIYKKNLQKSDACLYNIIFSETSSIIHPSFLSLDNNPGMESFLDIINQINKKNHKNAYSLKEDIFLREKLLNNIIFTPQLANNYKNIRALNNILFEGFKENNFVIQWLQKDSCSLQEIIASLIIVEEKSFSLNDKLKLIFKLGNLHNNTFFEDKDNLSLGVCKEIFYIIFKRFMIKKTKLEVERMVDYIVFKEKLMNYRYFLFYNQENENQVLKLIYDEDTTIQNDRCYLNVTSVFMEKLIFLQNYFNIKYLPEELIQMVLSLIENKEILNYNKFLILYESDNIRNLKIYEFNKQYKSLKRLKIWNIPKKNCDNFYKKLLRKLVKGYDFNNYSNLQIDFDKFKDIFYQLPYLSDLFRINYVFNPIHYNNINKVALPYVKFSLYSPEDDNIFIFVFTNQSLNKLDENIEKQNIFYIYNSPIYSYSSICKLVSMIRDYLDKTHFDITSKMIKYLNFAYYFSYSITTHFIENENIDYHDPFYMLEDIRIKDIGEDFFLEIHGKIKSKKEFTFDDNMQLNKKGYGKFFNYDGNFCGWREIREKKEKGIKKSYFTCLDEKYSNLNDFEKMFFE